MPGALHDERRVSMLAGRRKIMSQKLDAVAGTGRCLGWGGEHVTVPVRVHDPRAPVAMSDVHAARSHINRFLTNSSPIVL
mmetsp:Transcript_125469/g.360620  ORF Transcript_125469/g.360620 Transcript_125469/m.360620 type:complete len:80 (+) Transcript_125469:52-291(+)